MEIPESFWSLFRSKNREIYIDVLLEIHKEYAYSNYFLTREICLSVLNDYFSHCKIELEQEEAEAESEIPEPVASRVLHWLLRTKWLRRVEDYNSMTTYIVIPNYAGYFIDTGGGNLVQIAVGQTGSRIAAGDLHTGVLRNDVRTAEAYLQTFIFLTFLSGAGTQAGYQ